MTVIDRTVTEVHVYRIPLTNFTGAAESPQIDESRHKSFELFAIASTYKLFPPLFHICRLGNVTSSNEMYYARCSHSRAAQMLQCIAGLLPTL